MTRLASFNESLIGYEIEVLMVDSDDLQIIQVQRKPSPAHVKRLSQSIKKIGFVVPLIAVKSKKGMQIIDGQHRYLAGKKAGIKQYPCVVIPEKYSHQLMELNIEKQMSLRERAYVALNVYRLYLKENSDIKESDVLIQDSIEQAYYVTIGIAYEKNPRLFGSAYEPILKKSDFFIDKPISETDKIRNSRSKDLLDVHAKAQETVSAINKIGIVHPFLYKEVVSYCNPIKGKRKITKNFDELICEIKANLEDLKLNPSNIRKHKFSAEA